MKRQQRERRAALSCMPASQISAGRRGWYVATAALMAIATLAACSHANAAGGTPGGPGGFVRVGSISTVSSLNPWITDDTVILGLESDIYPRLVQYNLRTLEFEPDFATRWTQSADGRTLTFTTRPHAVWSDGTPLTAKDAAWTINTVVRLQNGAAAALASTVADVIRATATSPTSMTVTFRSRSLRRAGES